MYIHKSYVRRLEYIEEISTNQEKNDSLMIYPSYYKIPIITSNKEEIKTIIQYTRFFISQNYYFYIFGFIHFWIYSLL